MGVARVVLARQFSCSFFSSERSCRQ